MVGAVMPILTGLVAVSNDVSATSSLGNNLASSAVDIVWIAPGIPLNSSESRNAVSSRVNASEGIC